MAKINNFSFTSIVTFFSGDDCKKGKKKATPKTAHYQPLLFSVKYHSYDTKQYFGKQNEKQLIKTEYWFLLSNIIRCQEEKCKVCALREKQNKAKNVSLVEELHQLSFTK